MHLRDLLLPLMAASSVLAQSLPLRIVSFNIRYAASSRAKNELPWWTNNCPTNQNECRAYYLNSTLSDYVNDVDTAVIGLQEVLSTQLGDILGNLGSRWASIGVGRDDGKKQGEFSPILYDATALSVLFSETKWLSPTPDQVSFGWGAGSRRVVTIGVFEHKATGKRFIHANTHLDNASNQARVEGIKVVVARIKGVQAAYGPLGVTLTGDLNSDPNGEAYVTLRNMDYLTDLWDTAKRLGSNQLTYTGFSDTGISRIDYIFYGPNSANLYTPVQTEIVPNKVNGVYISDHRMVYGDLILK
ncbi:unnamed protein product [Discula destructiva]